MDVIYEGDTATNHRYAHLSPGINKLSDDVAKYLIKNGVVKPVPKKKIQPIKQSIKNKKNKEV